MAKLSASVIILQDGRPDPGLEPLVLNEPSLGLARIIILEIYKGYDILRKNDLTILLIEHAATTAVEFADTTLVLVGGKIAMQGEKAKMMNNAGVIRHYLGAAAAA